MSSRDQIIRTLAAHADAIREKGVRALYLFGSVARGEAGPGSDVDLFLDYDPTAGFSLIALIRLEFDLTNLLGAEVDVATRASLHPAFRDRILGEAIQVL